MTDYVRINAITGTWVEDLVSYEGPETDEIKAGPVPDGFILPRGVDADPAWVEGATQEQLDARAAFIAEEAKVTAADLALQPIIAASKELSRDPRAVAAVVYALGKAGYLAAETIGLAAHALTTPGATAADVRQSVIDFAAAVRGAEQNYIAALQAIKDAIDARNDE
jgi:hypothetical protein